MSAIERPVFFSCANTQLLGILHQPEVVNFTGVLIVVGGPQYRVGSHRQFVLLARYLAKNDIPVFRFDYRGMGDSSGDTVDFEQINPDISAAIDAFFAQVPNLQNVVLWGLCDAASAIMMYAQTGDMRISGQILLNPWVRTEEGIAKVYLKDYYLKRILDKDLWKKIVQGEFECRKAWSSLVGVCKKALQKPVSCAGEQKQLLPYTEQMLLGMEKFKGGSLFILSGNDLTAEEFRQYVGKSAQWQKILNCEGVQKKTLMEANHTFSKAVWRNEVAEWCVEWMRDI